MRKTVGTIQILSHHQNGMRSVSCHFAQISCHAAMAALVSPDGRDFLAPWAVGTSFRNVRQKPNLPTWKGNPSPQCHALRYAYTRGQSPLMLKVPFGPGFYKKENKPQMFFLQLK